MFDPIIEELHKIREEIAAENNYDLHPIVQSLRRSQRQVVNLHLMPTANATGAENKLKVKPLSAIQSAS